MNLAHYAAFELQDFLEDDFFVQWVINPDENNRSFWQSFTDTYPGKQETVNRAANTILVYRQQQFSGNEENKVLVWERINGSIRQSEPVQKRKTFRMPVFLRAAAAAIILLGAALWIYLANADTTYNITTAAGQKKTIILPDKSKVILNGSSSLTYHSSWNSENPREVWIKGEGYFTVQHLNKDSLQIKPSDRFIVHCGDVNIEVLGTTFNVKNRGGKTDIALLTGRIRIDNLEPTSNNQSMVLAPGDYVEYAGKDLLVSKKLAKPTQVVAWTSDEISFTDATLKEISETLQHRFGYSVIMQDTALNRLRIEGEITVDNVAELLDVVTTTLNVKIEQSANKHITISQ